MVYWCMVRINWIKRSRTRELIGTRESNLGTFLNECHYLMNKELRDDGKWLDMYTQAPSELHNVNIYINITKKNTKMTSQFRHIEKSAEFIWRYLEEMTRNRLERKQIWNVNQPIGLKKITITINKYTNIKNNIYISKIYLYHICLYFASIYLYTVYVLYTYVLDTLNTFDLLY